MKAHEMSIRKKKEHADHGQLGDRKEESLFSAVDIFIVVSTLAALIVIFIEYAGYTDHFINSL